MKPLTVTHNQYQAWLEFLFYKLEYQCNLEEKQCPEYWQFAVWPELKISIKDAALPVPDSIRPEIVAFQRIGINQWKCSSHQLTIVKDAQPKPAPKVTARDVITAAWNELNKN